VETGAIGDYAARAELGVSELGKMSDKMVTLPRPRVCERDHTRPDKNAVRMGLTVRATVDWRVWIHRERWRGV
jgi:hypothetical protein